MKCLIYLIEAQLKIISSPIHVSLFLKYESSPTFNLNECNIAWKTERYKVLCIGEL